MYYDGWYKTLRKSSSDNSHSIPSNDDSKESREDRTSRKNTEEINYALEGFFAVYNDEDITLKSKYSKGFEADDDFGDLGGDDGEDTADDTGDDGGFDDMGGDDSSMDTGGDDNAFGDMGGDDDFDSFGDDTDSYSDENGGEGGKKKKSSKVSRKEALNETYDQSTQIREVLEFPKKFQDLRNVIASNTDIALSQTHTNPKVEATIRKVGERYQDLLRSIDLYMKSMSTKLYEDLWSDYIEFHTIAKSLKLSFEALIAV